MNFTHHNFLGDIELNKKETQGIRFYNLPDGQWVPSITSVTSFYNREIFAKWRKRVGIEEANRITKKATARGTDFHEAAQAYLMNLATELGRLSSHDTVHVSSRQAISG